MFIYYSLPIIHFPPLSTNLPHRLRPSGGAGQNPAERSKMNRTCEIMFIVRPDVEEAELDKLVETISGYVTGAGGEVKST